MPVTIEAIVFDLYGTLLRIGTPLVHRGIHRALGIPTRPWMEMVRDELLASSFATPGDMVRAVCERLAPARPPEAEARCNEVLEQELASVVPFPGVRALLAFLQRRGYALGLVSNLTSAHKEPLARLGLAELFAAAVYSCDEGRCKPDPLIYHEVCRRLGVPPERVLVVGDSLANDVEAPRRLGMRALHVGGSGAGAISAISDLGWVVLDGEAAGRPLFEEVRLGGRRFALGRPLAVPDDEQGRYNLVSRVPSTPVDAGSGSATELFCKRFLFPEAAHVELFAHQVMAEAGLPVCQAALVDGPEPCLVVTRAPGEKFQGPVDPVLAFEVARQCAAAYVFSNADLRPRNAFVSHQGPRPVVTMIDLEHCFFNLALEVDGLDDPLRPQTFDRLAPGEIAQRLKRRVLSERTTRRAMRTFVELDRLDSEVALAFKSGWIATFESMRSSRSRLRVLMLERVYREPYLVIGTHAYRRAMARLDVEEVFQRLDEDPAQIFPRLAAVRGGKD
jgi:HAD superfamily hydrolase (TIGR01509 family)